MSKIGKKQIKDDAVGTDAIEDDSIESLDIKDGTLVDADISLSANIQLSKLNATGVPDGKTIISSGGSWLVGVGSGITPHAASHTDGTDDIFDTSSELDIKSIAVSTLPAGENVALSLALNDAKTTGFHVRSNGYVYAYHNGGSPAFWWEANNLHAYQTMHATYYRTHTDGTEVYPVYTHNASDYSTGVFFPTNGFMGYYK